MVVNALGRVGPCLDVERYELEVLAIVCMVNGHSSLTLCHRNSMKNIIGMKFLMLSYPQYYCYFALSLFRPLSPSLSFDLPLSLSLSCTHLKKKKIAAPFPDVRVVVAEQDEVSGKCSDTSTTTLQAQA